MLAKDRVGFICREQVLAPQISVILLFPTAFFRPPWKPPMSIQQSHTSGQWLPHGPDRTDVRGKTQSEWLRQSANLASYTQSDAGTAAAATGDSGHWGCIEQRGVGCHDASGWRIVVPAAAAVATYFPQLAGGTSPQSASATLFYFIMEYVDGTNLRQLMQAGQLSPELAVNIVPQVCDALQFAHDEGVVHRDIKPENILLDLKGRVRIADFGLAKIAGHTAEKPDAFPVMVMLLLCLDWRSI